jgi:hypothetical protein
MMLTSNCRECGANVECGTPLPSVCGEKSQSLLESKETLTNRLPYNLDKLIIYWTHNARTNRGRPQCGTPTSPHSAVATATPKVNEDDDKTRIPLRHVWPARRGRNGVISTCQLAKLRGFNRQTGEWQRAQDADWEAMTRGEPHNVGNLSSFLALPDSAEWHVHHEACDDTDDDGYWFDVGRADTHEKLLS